MADTVYMAVLLLSWMVYRDFWMNFEIKEDTFHMMLVVTKHGNSHFLKVVDSCDGNGLPRRYMYPM